MCTFGWAKDGATASGYDENTMARAVRLIREHIGDYESEWAAMKAISARLGMIAETLRTSGCVRPRSMPARRQAMVMTAWRCRH